MVEVTVLKFYDEYIGLSGGGTPYLIGSIGDKITAVIDINIHWETLNISATFNAAGKTITRNDLGNSFITDGFKIGDTFTVSGSSSNNGNFTIAAISATVIKTVEVIVNESAVGVNLNGTTPITALDFLYNLSVSQNTDYKSLVDDGTIQKFNATGLDASVVATTQFIAATVSKGWVNNLPSTKIASVSFTSFQQKFTITHDFYITPFFLAGQLQNLTNGNPAPNYFLGGNCLKYIFRVDAKFNNVDPTIPHTSDPQTFPNGNTGWFNEFLNGGSPEYSLTSIQYTDVATSDIVTEIDWTKQIDVEIHLFSKSGRFTNASTPAPNVVLNICYLPLKTSDYINTSTDLDHNFLHDRVLLDIGGASSNGQKYGTDLEQIVNAQAIYIDASHCKVKFRYNTSPYSLINTTLNSKGVDNRNYLIWVTPEKAITATTDTDRNAVICDTNTYFHDLDDASQWSVIDYTEFFQYPDFGIPFQDFKGFITDSVFSKTRFFVKRGSIFKNISIKIEPTNGTDSFVLRTVDFDLTGSYDNNNVAQVNILRNNGFKLAPDDERNISALFRIPDYDTINEVAYELDYGFKLRYEMWRLVNDFAPEFVNENLQKWSIYANEGGWQVNLNIYASVFDPSTNWTTNFKHTCNLTIKDDNSDITCVINTYDDAGAIIADTNILNDQPTTIVASFYGDFTTIPDGFDDYYGILYIDTAPTGGETFIDESTTEEDPLSSSYWMERATLIKVNNGLITLTSKIDNTKLNNQIKKYIYSARLGYKPSARWRILEDGSDRITESSDLRLLEDAA